MNAGVPAHDHEAWHAALQVEISSKALFAGSAVLSLIAAFL